MYTFYVCCVVFRPEHISKQVKSTATLSENPFLTAEVSEDSAHDLALQALAMETSRRASSMFGYSYPLVFNNGTPL